MEHVFHLPLVKKFVRQEIKQPQPKNRTSAASLPYSGFDTYPKASTSRRPNVVSPSKLGNSPDSPNCSPNGRSLPALSLSHLGPYKLHGKHNAPAPNHTKNVCGQPEKPLFTCLLVPLTTNKIIQNVCPPRSRVSGRVVSDGIENDILRNLRSKHILRSAPSLRSSAFTASGKQGAGSDVAIQIKSHQTFQGFTMALAAQRPIGQKLTSRSFLERAGSLSDGGRRPGNS